jgi:hypothetical protein
MEQFKNYEFEVINTSKGGDDFETWEYKIKNSKTGVGFNYIIQITKTALSCDPKGLISPVYEIVNTKGESLVKSWLNEGRETRLRAFISENNLALFKAEVDK